MKRQILISLVVSLAVSIGLFSLANHMKWINGKETVTIREKSVPVSSVLYTADEDGEMIPLDFSTIAEEVKDAVVHIQSRSKVERRQSYSPFDDMLNDPFYEFFFGPSQRPRSRRSEPEMRMGSGSGVIISPDGYVVTNNHVIKDADEIEITLLGKEKYIAEVIGTDPTTDIALLKIDAEDLSTLDFYDSDHVRVGEWVMAVGNPFNLNSTVTAGIVSAKGRSIHILEENYAIESFIQTDAAINPGNSGGALVNLNGELLGINTAIASPTGAYAGYGFAVPSNIVKKVIGDLMKYGIVQRGFLGVMIREVNQDLAEEENLSTNNGIYIDSLTNESAAAAAGVKEGDVILEVDGVPVNSVPKLQELIARKSPGDEVSLMIDRKGANQTYRVRLNNKEGNQTLLEARTTTDIENDLGVEFEDVSQAIKDKLNIAGGVRISKIQRGKIQQFTNVEQGFIITKVDNKNVTDKKELLKYLKLKRGGVLIEGVYEDKPGVYYFGLGM